MNPHDITKEFEKAICDYTGAPYCVALECGSAGMFLALSYFDIRDKEIIIPSHTYMSVPCDIIHAGGRVKFENSPEYLEGAYQLKPTNIYDSALRFTADMYIPDSVMILSFTGPFKHLKLGKAGAILTDNHNAYLWFKRSRYSGRRECSYFDDSFDMIGWNFYLNPMISALGVLLMGQFYDSQGKKINMPDIKKKYPDLRFHPYYMNK